MQDPRYGSAMAVSRGDCATLDTSDVLTSRRALFDLPGSFIYLDGNSLGAVAHGVKLRWPKRSASSGAAI